MEVKYGLRNTLMTKSVNKLAHIPQKADSKIVGLLMLLSQEPVQISILAGIERNV